MLLNYIVEYSIPRCKHGSNNIEAQPRDMIRRRIVFQQSDLRHEKPARGLNKASVPPGVAHLARPPHLLTLTSYEMSSRHSGTGRRLEYQLMVPADGYDAVRNQNCSVI